MTSSVVMPVRRRAARSSPSGWRKIPTCPKEKKSVVENIKNFFAKLLDSTLEHTVRDEYAQEVLDTLRGMAIMLSDEQKAETAYHHDRYGHDLLFLYFASKSTAISTVTPRVFCFLLLFV